jgi:hypothetical protein
MREVSDDFLLNMAEVTGAIMGLFLVGIFFFADTGFRRLGPGRGVVEPYIRASTRITLILFTIPLALSLTLVVLEPGWSTALFALLSLVLIAANVDTATRVRGVRGILGSPALLATEVVGTALVVVLLVLPWTLGGIDPSREDLTWAILLSFAAGLLSVFATVMTVFDLASQRPDPGDG